MEKKGDSKIQRPERLLGPVTLNSSDLSLGNMLSSHIKLQKFLERQKPLKLAGDKIEHLDIAASEDPGLWPNGTKQINSHPTSFRITGELVQKP